MSFLLACTIGILFATGTYMLLRRSFVKLIIGLGLIGHGANLLIITAAGINTEIVDETGAIVEIRGRPPLIAEGEDVLGAGAADPIPPALILTAIVISFAIVSYTIVLVKRTYQEVGTDDLNQMTATDLTLTDAPEEPSQAETGSTEVAA
ncbi:MAG: NADH-quinone oxidoreductase subunit K [Planctomycetota bacterium]